MHWVPKCEWCCDPIYDEDDVKYWPDDVPDHIPVPDGDDEMTYHRWCWDEVIADEELQLARRAEREQCSTP